MRELRIADLSINQITEYIVNIQTKIHSGEKFRTTDMMILQLMGEELERRGATLDISKLYKLDTEE